MSGDPISILFHEHDLVGRWINAQLKDSGFDLWEPVAFGSVQNNQLIGGIAFTEHSGPDIRVTIAGYGPWLTRRLLRVACAYAFVDLECQRISALIKRTNRTSRSVCARIGFKHEGTHRRMFPDGATGCSYGMVREDCKWIKRTHNG